MKLIKNNGNIYGNHNNILIMDNTILEFYYDNKEIENWGLIADDTNFIEKINYVINNKEKFSPRECFTKYNLDNCKNKWIDIISIITKKT